MKFRNLYILAVAASLSVACKGPEENNNFVGEYAKSLIADTTQAPYQIISATRGINIAGDIYVIGQPESTLLISESLVASDRFDNINGKKDVTDGLPDFAGETICPILDKFNSPYETFLADAEYGRLPEINVRNFVAASDTSCYLNAFDADKIVHKSRAKLVVLSDVYSSLYGYGDIDTLCTLTKSKVNVVSPVHEMLSQAWAQCGEGMNVGIWTTESVLGSSVYPRVFEEMKNRRRDSKARIMAAAPDTSLTVTERFLDFMRQYTASSENPAALQALIIDDMSVDTYELREAIKSVMAVDQDRYITYLNYLDKDFKVVEIREAVSAACYTILRKNNYFKHKIALPQVKMYVTTASERDSSYVTVELRDKYLTEDLWNMMKFNTLKLFEEYVRKEY